MKMLSTINPVGEVYEIEAIETHVSALAQTWNEQKPKSKWWNVWKKNTHLYSAAKFIIQALDELIVLVDDKIIKGADKKATVIAAVSLLYDLTIKEIMPIWLKPFSGKIKGFIIDVLVVVAVDWIVSKYRAGSWKAQLEEAANGESGAIAETST